MQTTTNTYEQTANDFLLSHGIEFKSEFIKSDFHFTGDTEKRDIYNAHLNEMTKVFLLILGKVLQNLRTTLIRLVKESIV